MLGCVELVPLLSISVTIAIAAKTAKNIKPENSGITFELMNIVLVVGVPVVWLTLPPLLPPPLESHIMMRKPQ